MGGTARLVIAALAATASSACVSVDGAPKPVIDFKNTAEIPDRYRVSLITEEVGEEVDQVKAKRLRNRTIAIYMAAMDARYSEFRKALAGESKGWNAGLDISVLGVSSLGAVAKRSSSKLAAFAAFLAGSRTSLNKEIYFDRTLPALISAMDTSRTRVRAAIVPRMREDISQYPMELAFSDLAGYELSASIDGAIQQVTVDAAATAKEVDEKYKNALESCNPVASLRPFLQRLNHYIYDLAAAADGTTHDIGSVKDGQLDKLSKIAVELDVSPSGKAKTKDEALSQAKVILAKTADVCTINEAENLFVRMKGVTGEIVP